MSSQTLSPLRNFGDASQQIEYDLQNGLFTPFLGAGTSSLRPKLANVTQFPWKGVAQTLAAVCAELEGDERSIRYLQSFARQRLGMGDDGIQQYIPADRKPEVADVLRDHRLAQLQAALVKATMRLTYYFGQRFADCTPSIHRLQEAWVPFEVEDENAVEAIKALFDGVDLSRELRQKNKDSPFLRDKPGVQRELQIQRMRDKLLILILSLVPRNQDLFSARFDVHDRILRRLPDMFRKVSDSERRLRLDAVQWLSELIWYTLRYWVPRYPTTAELAFELSLGVKYGTARRAELAQAAEALSLSQAKNLEREIQMLITYCEPGTYDSVDREAAAFFYAVAAAVQHEFDLYLQNKDFTPNPVQRFKTKSAPAHGYPVPIVFTTNFDQALEHVFSYSNLAYHVVFPVVLDDNGAQDTKKDTKKNDRGGAELDTGRVVWILRTYFKKEEQSTPHDMKWEEAFPGDHPSIDFVGPVIVKLHGSPSEPKPVILDQKWKHWLVLSEGGYLQAMSDTHRMPGWLGEELHASYGAVSGEDYRSVWFLGYSLSDWNVRLHLYQHGRQALGPRNAVDRDSDVYRRAILSNLDVVQWLGDLNRLPRMIDSVLDDDAIETSTEVDSLVKKLRTFLREVNG